MKYQLISFLAVLGLTFILSGCALNPVSKQNEFVLMSEAQEIELGRKTDPQIIKEYGYYDDADLQGYLNSICQKLAVVSDRPKLYFRCKITDSPVVNAFALPGGYIYVNRGLLALLNSEAELAGVLGHEMGHVCARHHVRQHTKQGSYQIFSEVVSIFVPETRSISSISDLIALAVIRGFGRENELEADRLGMKYAARAGYDIKALGDFLNILQRMEEESGQTGYHGLFSTHPETERRIDRSLMEIEKFGRRQKTAGLISPEDYKNKINGLLYGLDPREGIVVNSIFRHPDLRFEMTFPSQWEIDNRKTVLGARHPQKKFFIQMRVKSLGEKIDVESLAEKISRDLGLIKLTGGPVNINGLRAYKGTYRGKEKKLGAILVVAGFIILQDKVYKVIGFSKAQEFKEARPYLDKTILSFRELTSKEAGEFKPNRIRIYTIKAGDTLEKITKKFGRDPHEVKKLAILNNLPAGVPLRVGDKIKIITDRPGNS